MFKPNIPAGIAVLLAILLSSFGAKAYSQDDLYLLPMPQELHLGENTLSVTEATLDMPEWETEWIEALQHAGIEIAEQAPFRVKGLIVSKIADVPGDTDEAYSLNISSEGMTIQAVSPKGLYWALQTFRQLAAASPANTLTECEIIDWPAFPWRGFMMDAGRSYISLEELRREIETMARFKLNVFHWHLTENQAWRLESKIYPMLNDSINMTREPGKYYTLEQARELEQFAKAHNILLVPEIDMPGHSEAFTRTFGTDMQSEQGMKILEQLIDEICETFEGPYLHIGTDEVKFTNKDFVPRMVKHVRDHDKKVISWNPGWKYNEGEVDMTMMWSFRGKPTPGIPAVDLQFHYINHFDPYADLVALFRSNVYGHKKSEDGIIGAELGLWNDRYIENESDIIAQNSVYSSLLALAERLWRGGGNEYFDVLGTKLTESQHSDFAQFAEFENRLLWHKKHTLADLNIPYVKQQNVKWLISDPFPNDGDLSRVFPPETEGLKDKYLYDGNTYNTNLANGAAVYLRHTWGKLIPSFYSEPLPNHTAYAYTWVYSPYDQTVGLQAATQDYSRSEADIPPPNGKWDYRESKFWINDIEIPAPQWNSNHSKRDNEVPLTNENFTMRKPIPVNLHRGWNKVLIKLPVGEFSTPEVRLVKWMFTCVFTTPDGQEAAPGLIYSPERVIN